MIARAAAATADEMQQYYRMHLTNDLMKDLGAALSRIPGRKNVIWLSEAFPINMSIGPGGPETAYVTDRLTGTGRALAKADAAVYPVDTRGLVAPSGGQSALGVSMSERQRHATLDLLAATTGGRAFYDSNDIAAAIGEAVDDTEITYTLGFYPGPGGEDGNFHRLQIDVKRPGVTLRYRRGYVAADPHVVLSDLDGREEIRDALTSPLDVPGIAFSVRLEPRDPKRPGWMPMTIAVPTSEVMLADGEDGHLATMDLIISQHAADGRALLTVGDVVRPDLRRTRGETLLKEGLLVRRQIQLAIGVARLRVVVFDRGSGRVGSLEFPVSAR